MKQLFVISILATVALFNVKAIDADLFCYDQKAVITALSDLSEIESYVSGNQGISIVDLMKTGNFLVNGVDTYSSPFGINGEPPMGCPSFLWGCVFGWLGILLVYILTDNDKEEVKKALWGCITVYAIVGVIYIVAIAASAGESTYYYSTY